MLILNIDNIFYGGLSVNPELVVSSTKIFFIIYDLFLIFYLLDMVLYQQIPV